METKELVLQEFEQHKGEFIIIGFDRVERLIAITSDEYDYLYLTYDGRKMTNHTCLVGFVPLKNKIDKSDYDTFIRIAKLNHRDQITGDDEITKAIELAKQEMIDQCKLSVEFLTEPCWDLN